MNSKNIRWQFRLHTVTSFILGRITLPPVRLKQSFRSALQPLLGLSFLARIFPVKQPYQFSHYHFAITFAHYSSPGLLNLAQMFRIGNPRPRFLVRGPDPPCHCEPRCSSRGEAISSISSTITKPVKHTKSPIIPSPSRHRPQQKK